MSEISDLFARDPLSLTREDRNEVVAHYRDNRLRYMQGAKAPKPEKVKVEPGKKLDLNDLGDLEL